MDDRDPYDVDNKNDQAGRQTGRDERGRWLPGHCPNRAGRRGKPKVNGREMGITDADLRVFANTLVEMKVNGETVNLTRYEALHLKEFEKAMAGSVYATRDLLNRIKEQDKTIAELVAHYDGLVGKYFGENSNIDRIPEAVLAEINELRRVLNFYYPGQYSSQDQDWTRYLESVFADRDDDDSSEDDETDKPGDD